MLLVFSGAYWPRIVTTKEYGMTGVHRKINRFNMVEVAIAVTIVVSVISLCTPAIYRYALQAKATSCKSNLTQLSQWIHGYSSEWGGFLPAYEDGWVQQLSTIGNISVDQSVKPKGVLSCPAQSFEALLPDIAPKDYWRGTNYGINQHIASGLTNNYNEYFSQWTQANIGSFKDPSAKAVLADASGSNFFGIPNRDPVITGMNLTGSTYADALSPSPATPLPYLRHYDNTANFLFADGHVEGKRSWPSFMDGRNSAGYFFWHGEHPPRTSAIR